MQRTIKKVVYLFVLTFICTKSFAQTFNFDGFKFSVAKPLQQVIFTKDEVGNDIKVYQLITEGKNVIVNMVISIQFKSQITDVEAYNKKV